MTIKRGFSRSETERNILRKQKKQLGKKSPHAQEPGSVLWSVGQGPISCHQVICLKRSLWFILQMWRLQFLEERLTVTPSARLVIFLFLLPTLINNLAPMFILFHASFYFPLDLQLIDWRLMEEDNTRQDYGLPIEMMERAKKHNQRNDVEAFILWPHNACHPLNVRVRVFCNESMKQI